jgi:Raf kinase inhibitor-like YbhB/YbcL family protein
MRFFKTFIPVIILMGGILFFISAQAKKKKEEKVSLSIESTAFKEGEVIPVEYTCSGADLSPELSWSGAPEKTKSFALINDDPDAPAGTWDHWLVYNIPASTAKLAKGIKTAGQIGEGVKFGKNSWGKMEYGGPCPPPGSFHRYFFKLYALDTVLDPAQGAKKAEIEKAMEGHILGKTELMGKFKR